MLTRAGYQKICAVIVALCAAGLLTPAGATTIHTTETPIGGAGPSGTNACDGGGYGVDGCTTYELGMVFQSSADGWISAIRYWRADSEPFANGSHVGNIWDAYGTLLASTTFVGETGVAGWQEQALATPLAILANTSYTVSVNTLGYYVYTLQGLQSSIVNGPLSSVAGTSLGSCYGPSSANGRFGASGSFPTGSFNCNNYFRDVQFTTVDPQVVPMPAAVWLFGSALGAMTVLRRKRAVRNAAGNTAA